VALGVGAYIAFLLSSLPATTAYRALTSFSAVEANGIDFAGIQGTIWSGSASLGSVGGLAVHDVRWQLRAWPLLLGRLAGRFEAQLDDGFINAQLRASASSVRFDDLRVSTSLPALSSVLPLQGMQGLASATFTTLELRDGWPAEAVGELRLAQLQARPLIPTGAPGLIPLGDYEVRFTETADEGLAAAIRDAGGPLEVTGTLALDRERRYLIDALLLARPSAPQALLDGIAVMTAEPDAAGRRRLMLTGSL
jgi:hypothetical protein